MPDCAIENLDPDAREVRDLIATADAYYQHLYPTESNHLEPAEALKRNDVVFVGCRLEGRVAACGAAKIMHDDGTYGEIKRVFVREEFRGRGFSRRIMEYLETELIGRQIEWMRLETGIHQPAALALYRKLGYRERGPFGAYREDPLSVFMEKRHLARGSG